jgi:hypothetical protein
MARVCAKFSARDLLWSEHPTEPLTSQAWDNYRSVLASKLPFKDWIGLALCAMTVSSMNFERERARRENNLLVEQKTVSYLQKAGKRLEKGEQTLLRVSQSDGGASSVPADADE